MTIDEIKNAISVAEKNDPGYDLFSIDKIKILSGNSIRILLNQLAKKSSHYLEAGVYCGGSFCAAVYGNDHLVETCAIDHWNENLHYANGRNSFIAHVAQYHPKHVKFTLIEKNHWDVNQLPFQPDLYYYDGAHDAVSQEKALTHFGKMCQESFVYCVDDFNNAEVKIGTHRGLKNFEVEFTWELNTPFNAKTLVSPYVSPWWNGFAVYKLRQK